MRTIGSVDSEERIRLPVFLPVAGLLVICAAAVVLSFFVWSGIQKGLSYYGRFSRYDKLILESGRRNGVDPRLLKAVIWRESRFDPMVRGSKGEVGLMQVMPKYAAVDWAQAHGLPPPTDGMLSDPELNIEIGSWYLGRALYKWRLYEKATALALAEYNAGATRVDAWRPDSRTGEVRTKINIASTRSYVEAIERKYKKYCSSWNPDPIKERVNEKKDDNSGRGGRTDRGNAVRRGAGEGAH